MRPIEEVTRELAQVIDELIALPDGEFAARHALLTRQDELRAEADQFDADFDEQRPTRDILSELTEARTRRRSEIARLSGRNMMSGPGGGGGSAGAVSAAMVELSLKAKDARSLGALEQRIGRLESLLIARGVSIGVADERVPLATPAIEPEGI